MANVLTLITNLIKYINDKSIKNPLDLSKYYKKINLFKDKQGKNTNSANKMGSPFEEFIKDLYANTLDVNDNSKRKKLLDNVFAYHGNSTNPPDAVLSGKHGDAIEFKKVQGNGTIQLNSSYFHHCLDSYDSRIDASCKHNVSKDIHRYEWHKDLLYTIGHITKQKRFKSLIMFYGKDYAKSNSYYEYIEDQIHKRMFPELWTQVMNNAFKIMWEQYGHNYNLSEFKDKIINNLKDNNLTYLNKKSNEIGRVNNVDSTGTYLRIRGMWGLNDPIDLINSFMAPTKGINLPKAQQLSLTKPAAKKTNKILKDFVNNKTNKFSLILVIDTDKLKEINNSDYSKFRKLASNTPNLKITHTKLMDPNIPSSKTKYPRKCDVITYSFK